MPELLEQAQQSPTTWKQLRPCIGKRGEWLIRQNPNWEHLIEEVDPELWRFGRKADRLRLLQHLRQSNPTQGRELLESTWKKEGLRLKKQFLEQLEIGLTATDEAFLEQCLDEGKKELRYIAAKLLVKVENSAYQQRLLKRLKTVLTFQAEANTSELLIELPDQLEEEMIRDGIDPSIRWYPGGLKASRLGQMVALLPPAQWQDLSSKTAKATFDLFLANEYAAVLLQGLVESLTLHQNEEWMTLILEHWMAHFDEKIWQKISLQPLLEVLPNALFNRLTLAGLQSIVGLPEEQTPVDQLLKLSGQQWSDALTQQFIQQLHQWMNSAEASSWGGWNIRQILKQAAYQVNPQLKEILSENWPVETTVWSGWEKEVGQFLQTLYFRQQMAAAFTEATT
ncbi:MAG: DUF5691 domain-containing protein [Bacteroidota bacterium]